MRSIVENERLYQTGGDQFVPPRQIEPTEGAFLKNIRTGEIWPFHETLARMGDQIFVPTDEKPAWWDRRVQINEAKAAAALADQVAEQEREEQAYLAVKTQQAAREQRINASVAETAKRKALPKRPADAFAPVGDEAEVE
jgi:hypothetical protein